jgi:group I intron endonuclease
MRRWSVHINSANKGSRYAIHAAIRKYGVGMFLVETLCCVPYDALNNMEAYYAEQYETYTWDVPGGYNMVWCGGSRVARSGLSFADETRAKLSARARGRVISEAQRRQISQTLTGRTGHKHSPEVCKRMSERMKGNKPTTESIEKMRQTKLAQNLKDKNRSAYGSSILTMEQCNDIRAQKGIQTQKELAAKYGVSLAHLGHIQRFIPSEK